MLQSNNSIGRAGGSDRKQLSSCAYSRAKGLLREANLRPTRQRLMIAHWLFCDGGDKHVTAEMVFKTLWRRDESLVLCTVYNTLNKFTECGLLRRLRLSSNATYYDTNVVPHHHMIVGNFLEIHDVPYDFPGINCVSSPYEGRLLKEIDIIFWVSSDPEPGLVSLACPAEPCLTEPAEG